LAELVQVWEPVFPRPNQGSRDFKPFRQSDCDLELRLAIQNDSRRIVTFCDMKEARVDAVNLAEKLALFDDRWAPKIVAEIQRLAGVPR